MSVTQVQTIGITNDAVTATQIAAGAVGTTEIAANAVTTAEINFQNALVPVGGIIMWTGTTIPTGWALCNGAPGSDTPDLTNRFIVGAANVSKTGTTSQVGSSPYDPGDVGGSADATLVSHTHTVTSTSAANGGFFKSFFVSIGRIAQFPPFDAINSFAQGSVNGDFSDTGVSSVGRGSLDSAGSPATNANLPPYYALAFIMRTS